MRRSTFGYWANQVLELKKAKSKSTLDNYSRALRLRLLPYFGNYPIEKITLPLIQKYMASRANFKLADDIKHLNQILRFARSSGENVPHFRIKNPDIPSGRPRAYSREEVARLLEASRGDMHLVILFAVTMGMRQHEILNLTWELVDVCSGTIYLPPWYQKTRTTVDREFPINKTVYAHLVRIKNKSGKIFSYRSRAEFNNAWVKLKRKAKVRGRFHDLRHTCISRMLAAGISHIIVQKMLGVSPQIMRRYTHIPRDIAEKAVNL